MLDLAMLKAMPEGTLFAQGEGLYPTIFNERIRWVAKCGYVHDWAIYYHLESKSFNFVREYGDKLMSETNIRMLVPCDDQAMSMYRF